tara:strand:+ start:349 stop:579 length:231 start_codon:yes stop_codon:yes gene_type:complete
MKNPSQEIEHLKKVIEEQQEKLIGDILHHISIYEIKKEEFEEMKKSIINYTSETFRILKAIESQEIIEKVLISGIK